MALTLIYLDSIAEEYVSVSREALVLNFYTSPHWTRHTSKVIWNGWSKL